MPERRRGKPDCRLYDRKTDKPVADKEVESYWETGEIDVTGSRPPQGAANLFQAQDDATAKAFERFSDKYYCGGSCGRDRLCSMRIKVLRTRSPRVIRRMVRNDPDSFAYRRLGQKESEHVYLRLEVEVAPECECVERPRVVRPPGEVQVAGNGGAVGGIVSFDD